MSNWLFGDRPLHVRHPTEVPEIGSEIGPAITPFGTVQPDSRSGASFGSLHAGPGRSAPSHSLSVSR
jgi:hypothetical protein